MNWEAVQALAELIAAYGVRGHVFGEAFQSHVEDVIMTREPHARARPFGAFAIGDPPE